MMGPAKHLLPMPLAASLRQQAAATTRSSLSHRILRRASGIWGRGGGRHRGSGSNHSTGTERHLRWRHRPPTRPTLAAPVQLEPVVFVGLCRVNVCGYGRLGDWKGPRCRIVALVVDVCRTEIRQLFSNYWRGEFEALRSLVKFCTVNDTPCHRS